MAIKDMEDTTCTNVILHGQKKRYSHWRETELGKFLVPLYEGEGAEMGRSRLRLSRPVMLDRLG